MTDKKNYFNEAVKNFLNNNPSLTKIKFIANSNNTNKNNRIGTSGAYMVAGSDNTLEIHTAAAEFVFNADCSSMFDGLSTITAIDFNSCVNTSKVTKMNDMFKNCYKLTSLDLSSFNTANVTDMSNMFFYCKKLAWLNLLSFDFSKVTNFDDMFYALGQDVAVQPVYIYVKDEKDKAKLEAEPIGIANYSMLKSI